MTRMTSPRMRMLMNEEGARIQDFLVSRDATPHPSFLIPYSWLQRSVMISRIFIAMEDIVQIVFISESAMWRWQHIFRRLVTLEYLYRGIFSHSLQLITRHTSQNPWFLIPISSQRDSLNLLQSNLTQFIFKNIKSLPTSEFKEIMVRKSGFVAALLL